MKRQKRRRKLFNWVVRKPYFLLVIFLIGSGLLIGLCTKMTKGVYIVFEDVPIKQIGNQYSIEVIGINEGAYESILQEGDEVIWFTDPSANRHKGYIRKIQCTETSRQYRLEIEIPKAEVSKAVNIPLQEEKRVTVELKVRDIPLLRIRQRGEKNEK
nr:hypothetical protein [uncultured Cellulosilyticum sp.]